MPEDLIWDPVFRYKVRLTPRGGVLHGEFWVEPGGGGAIEHLHPSIEERFHILAGRISYRADGEERGAGAGDRFTVPAGVAHSFVNVGDRVAHLEVEMEPPGEMGALFRESAALAAEKRLITIGRRGLPRGPISLLEMADFLDRHRETIVMTSPPQLLQRVAVPPLARLNRWRKRQR